MKNNKLVNAALCLIILPAVILSFSFSGEDAEESATNSPLYKVKKAPLTIKVTVPGTITSSQSVSVVNEVKGSRSVMWVIEEGKKVKKGDLLVELENSDLVDEKEKMEIQVSDAELALLQAKEDLEIVKKQGEADLKDSQINYDFSKQDLQKYTEGEYIQKVKELKANITLAEAQVERAEDRLNWTKKLNKEGYVTNTELQTDELSVQRENLKLDTAKGAFDLYEKFTHPKAVTQYERLVERRKFELERTQHKISSNVFNYKARLRSREVDLDRKRQKLAEIVEEIELCKLKAPINGLVVYASSQQSSKGRKTNSQPLEQGVTVKQRETLIRIPTSQKMHASFKLPETALNIIRKGMATSVQVDALNSIVLNGTLQHIDPMPNPGSLWMNPNLKEYSSEVVIAEEDVKGMRPGMSCKIDILAKHFDSTISVPAQCVIKEKKKSIVYVVTQNGPEKREVETGMDDGVMVQIKNGLAVKEEIMLAPPLEESTKPEVAPEEFEMADGTPPATKAKKKKKSKQEKAPL
ncbi:MAG: HlyD family efflux transporter periplasmic adaptor subunit [Lentisphaerales bacterium]|nr:HlyD family efflux transporter periplasmic adaptor subunit [Lentisphaerales bacterium]